MHKAQQQGTIFDIKVGIKVGEEITVNLPEKTRIEKIDDTSGKKVYLICSGIANPELPEEEHSLVFVPTGEQYATHGRSPRLIGRFAYYDPDMEDSAKQTINIIELEEKVL